MAARPLRSDAIDHLDALQAIEDDAVPGLRRKFLDAVAGLSDGIDLDALRAALLRRDTPAVMAMVPFDSFEKALQSVIPALEQVAADAHDVAGAELAHQAAQGALSLPPAALVRLGISFSLISERARLEFRLRAAELIREISDETREAIREMVERQYLAGTHPNAGAREIRQIVGLTRRQARAVERFRAAQLEAGAKPAVAERRTERYAARLRKQRAELIARTEAARAVNEGQRATWADLVERGLLDPSRFEREWVTLLPLPRVCDVCTPLDGQRAPLVGGTYPDGSAGPPRHPDCRCTERVVARRPDATAALAP